MLTSQRDSGPTVIDVVHQVFDGQGPTLLSVQGPTGTAVFVDVDASSMPAGLVVTSTPAGMHEITGEICGASVTGVAYPGSDSGRYGSVRMAVRMLSRRGPAGLANDDDHDAPGVSGLH